MKIKDKYALADHFLKYCQRNNIEPEMAADALILSVCAIIAEHSKDGGDRARGAAIAASHIRHVLEITEH